MNQNQNQKQKQAILSKQRTPKGRGSEKLPPADQVKNLRASEKARRSAISVGGGGSSAVARKHRSHVRTGPEGRPYRWEVGGGRGGSPSLSLSDLKWDLRRCRSSLPLPSLPLTEYYADLLRIWFDKKGKGRQWSKIKIKIKYLTENEILCIW